MTKLLVSPASPYSAKVRMAATYAGIAFEDVMVDTGANPEELISHNPLGKIPCLVTDEGEGIFDSRAITQYLNRQSRNSLFPTNAVKRTAAERLEALADGIADSALAHVYERRARPEEKVHQPWLDRQWAKVERGLDFAAENLPRASARADAGQIALRAVLAYLELRFAGKWDKGRSKLKRWAAKFDERFPELVPFLPR